MAGVFSIRNDPMWLSAVILVSDGKVVLNAAHSTSFALFILFLFTYVLNALIYR